MLSLFLKVNLCMYDRQLMMAVPSNFRCFSNCIYVNVSKNLQQALRQQYQQFLANGIHNGMNSQPGANVNAALAPFIGMSNPGFFNGTIPQHILSHINEVTTKLPWICVSAFCSYVITITLNVVCKK